MLRCTVVNTINKTVSRVKSLTTSTVGECRGVGSCKGLVPKRKKVLSHFSDIVFATPVVFCLSLFLWGRVCI